jgi:hypothetical protein
MTRVLRLTLLAPDIVEAIAGREAGAGGDAGKQVLEPFPASSGRQQRACLS